MLETLSFLGQFVLRPRVVGAVAPSSRALARTMAEWISWPEVAVVVEYGPGTGVFTQEILNRMRPGTRVIAVEVNPGFASRLAVRFPAVRVHRDSVQNIRAICEREGIGAVDAIVSGLPWASFSGQYQRELLQATCSVLRPGGQFTSFAYLQGLLMPSGRRFRGQLGRYFRSIQTSRVVWKNIPPAFAYRCRR